MKFLGERRTLTILPLTGAAFASVALSAVALPAPAVLAAFIAQQDESPGEVALATARSHMAAGRYESALRAYEDALSWLPGNAEAMEGKRTAEALLNRGQSIDQTAQEQEILREQARVRFDAAMARSAELLGQDNFEEAQWVTLTAQVEWNRSRDLFSEAEFTQRARNAERRLTEIRERREVARLARERQAIVEARDAQSVAERREAEARQRSIDEKITRIRQLQLEMRYSEALQVVEEILFIDGNNPSALVLRDVIEMAKISQDYSAKVRLSERSQLINKVELKERTVLPTPNRTGPGMRGLSDLLQYPEDWQQLSIQRLGDTGFRESEADLAVLQRLNSTYAQVDFRNNTFASVIRYFEQASGLRFYTDWKSMEMIGVSPDDEITLDLASVPISVAIERVLEQLGDISDRPQYAVQDGSLTIASDEALRRKKVMHVYDINDLIFEVPYFDNAPQLDLGSALDQGSGGGSGGGGGRGGGGGGRGGGGTGGGGGGSGGGGGGGGSLFGNPGGEPQRTPREDLIARVLDIIIENVDTEGWRDRGGTTGTIQELNGNLIVTNTPTNHRKIAGLLSMLREIRAVQINVETRVLTVSTDWFERIGIDLDVYFNTNRQARRAQRAADPLSHLSDFFDASGRLRDPLIYGSLTALDEDGNPTAPFNAVAYGQQFGIPTGTPPTDIQYITGPVGQPIRATSGFTPIAVGQNSLGLVDTIAGLTDFGKDVLAGAPALVTGFQFLDDIQVDLLIEATQADKRSLIMTAPRVTFMNGQRVWIGLQQQQAYVVGLRALTGDSSGAFAPEIDTLVTGIVLDVEAVVSADRRYVTMTVNFAESQLLALVPSDDFEGAAGGGGTGGGDAAQFTGRVQLPTIAISTLRTTVSVPDKGTVLLGGQRRVSEFETETGVPVLSKIPFINRFFTNRITSKAEETRLILIRPEIIIQQENEDILFPALSDRIGSGVFR
ncbi:MAG: hypothetical protein KF817_11770 [Phycisphaeraceae bacterium]|nr:hypothetical protein [Phycisphaeraceae bacterium]